MKNRSSMTSPLFKCCNVSDTGMKRWHYGESSHEYIVLWSTQWTGHICSRASFEEICTCCDSKHHIQCFDSDIKWTRKGLRKMFFCNVMHFGVKQGIQREEWHVKLFYCKNWVFNTRIKLELSVRSVQNACYCPNKCLVFPNCFLIIIVGRVIQ